MRRRTDLTAGEKAIEFLPTSVVDHLDFRQLFEREAPLEIDLGCGDGTFLVAIAAQNPDRNFLGIERLAGRVRVACRKVARMNLRNARILRMEVTYALAYLIPPGAVSVIYFLFPDPWPKRRHHCRRTFTGEFLFSIARALTFGGLFHIATDDAAYFSEIRRVIAANPIFDNARGAHVRPLTKFEQRFAESGSPIYKLVLQQALVTPNLAPR